MTNHEMGLDYGILQNCKDLIAEVYIQAFEDLVLCLQGIWPYKGSWTKKLSFDDQLIACNREASNIYGFFEATLSESDSAFTPKIFLKRACVKAGIPFETGLKKCKPEISVARKEAIASDFTKKVLSKVVEELSRDEEETE